MQVYLYSHTTDESKEVYDKFVLCHYPILSYPGMYQGFYQLHGHVHTRLNNTGLDASLIKYLINSYDVGVDNNNFTPISQSEVVNILN